MYRILIVDDHPLIADGLKNLLKEYRLCDNTSWAQSGKDCLLKLKSDSFDLILLDISLPDVNGIDLCKTIKTEFPACRILALTSFGEFNWVHSMMANGASGYLLKNAMAEEIVRGVETVMHGEIFLCHEVDILMKKETDKHIFLTRRETE
ncbi:MAG TPA: response regulator transcription factor, partial [Bacteroidales bacterium]|nr:response regulator transcription factor [Bacteroidales bacterium]